MSMRLIVAVEAEQQATHAQLYVTDKTVRETFPDLPLQGSVWFAIEKRWSGVSQGLWRGTQCTVKDMFRMRI
jgi:hypothetical protein